MASLGQPDLGEIRHHGEFLGVPVLAQPEPGDRSIRRPWRTPIRAEVTAQDTTGYLSDWEGRDRRAHMTTGIAVLQPPGEDNIKRSTRHNSELASYRHGPRQWPG
jgi:hypothetical protein